MFSHLCNIQSVLKSGGQYLYDEEAIYSNISNCKQLAGSLETSIGPYGMKKLIVNHIDKLYVTSDNTTLVSQLEVQHPAAKILISAAQMQHQEFGDGTNYIIVLAGELLHNASLLMQQGYHIADIVKGYQNALDKTLNILPSLACYKLKCINSHSELSRAITSVILSKVNQYQTIIASLTAEAILSILPPNPINFNLDNIRVAKVLGGSVESSFVVKGMVITRDVSSTVKEKHDCKVIVLGCGLELLSTETKGTVLIHTAEQLVNFSRGEEKEMEDIIRYIANIGVGAIIVGGNISDLGQHYCNKYNILTLKCQSKFELRRICRALSAPSMIKLCCPTPEDIGFAGHITVKDISSNKVTVIESADSSVSTIVLRGATSHFLDEIERGIFSATRTIKNITKDNNFLPGAGATEIEIRLQLDRYGRTVATQEQGAIRKFGEAFEKIPRIIISNSGLPPNKVLPKLYAQHMKKKSEAYGINIEGSLHDCIIDVISSSRTYPIIDHLKTRESSIKLAVDAVTTILTINKICTARPAGGPKPPQQTGHWDED